MEELKAKKTKGNNVAKKWEKVKLKENTDLYMEVETGELILKNPESDTEWEMYKSTSTDKVSYYCEKRRMV